MSGVIQDNFLRVLNPVSGEEISSIEVSNQKYINDILEKSQVYATWQNLNLNKRPGELSHEMYYKITLKYENLFN